MTIMDSRFFLYNENYSAEYCRQAHTQILKAQQAVVCVDYAGIYKNPLHHTQHRQEQLYEHMILWGDKLEIYQELEHCYWVRACPFYADTKAYCHYVGYIHKHHVKPQKWHPYSHIVIAPQTHCYSSPSCKSPIVESLTIGSGITLTDTPYQRNFAQTLSGSFIHHEHCQKLPQTSSYHADDFVKQAYVFENQPYVWGGAFFGGIDCSGLVYVSLKLCGYDAPRDSDQQALHLGDSVIFSPQNIADSLCHGDLLFWKGHVGIYDKNRHHILHANEYHMAVKSCPFDDERMRIYHAIHEDISVIKRIVPA